MGIIIYTSICGLICHHNYDLDLNLVKYIIFHEWKFNEYLIFRIRRIWEK